MTRRRLQPEQDTTPLAALIQALTIMKGNETHIHIHIHENNVQPPGAATAGRARYQDLDSVTDSTRWQEASPPAVESSEAGVFPASDRRERSSNALPGDPRTTLAGYRSPRPVSNDSQHLRGRDVVATQAAWLGTVARHQPSQTHSPAWPLCGPANVAVECSNTTAGSDGAETAIQPRWTASNPNPADVWDFRRVLDDYRQRHGNGKTAKSWQQYTTLLRKWEQFHSGRGPDVRDVTPDALQAFFESRTEWKSRQSWKRNRDQMLAMLKAMAAQTASNPGGLAESPLWDSLDHLPVWRLPPTRWFADRSSNDTDERRGHVPFEGDILTPEEFLRVLNACDSTDRPLWWRSLHAWVITYGSRRGDFLGLTWDRIDLARKTVITNETKKGNRIVVPLAERFVPALQRLRAENDCGPWYSNSTHLDRWFYPVWRRIWAVAGVPVRNPHQLRDECSNWWNEHAREFGNLITGHATGNVRDQHYDRNRRGYITPAFRNAVESFPGDMEWPSL